MLLVPAAAITGKIFGLSGSRDIGLGAGDTVMDSARVIALAHGMLDKL